MGPGRRSLPLIRSAATVHSCADASIFATHVFSFVSYSLNAHLSTTSSRAYAETTTKKNIQIARRLLNFIELAFITWKSVINKFAVCQPREGTKKTYATATDSSLSHFVSRCVNTKFVQAKPNDKTEPITYNHLPSRQGRFQLQHTNTLATTFDVSFTF